MQAMPIKVLISHARGDAAFARKVAREVEKSGGQVFFDEWSLTQGVAIGRRIQDALRRCDVLIAIVGKASARSPWLNSEVGAAVALGKKVTVIADGVLTKELPPTLRSHQIVDSRRIDRYDEKLSTYVMPEKVAS